jgi:hypothetical protein
MRTTLALDDDAIDAIHSHAQANGASLGKAASELILRGVRYQMPIRRVNGFPVLDAPEGIPPVTTEQVRALLDEE